jgi:hypothetical protein
MLSLFFIVSSVVSYSKNDALLRPLHKSLIGFGDIAFKVRADRDATVSLLGAPGISWLAHYTLTIGHGDDTTLRVLNNTHDILVEQHTPDIISPTEMKTFWLEWKNYHVAFGRGSVVGQDQVLEYVDPSQPYVHSVAFSNGGDIVGTWELGTVDIVGMCMIGLCKCIHAVFLKPRAYNTAGNTSNRDATLSNTRTNWGATRP